MKKVVIDIGGTSIKYALMDMEANIYDQKETATPRDSLDSLLNVICNIYYQYEEVDGIALSMPGNIDSDTGQIYTPGSLVYNENINIIDKLHERLKVMISVENDAKCAALAEVWKGNLKDCDDGIVLIIGTGIGGGIVHQKEAIKGKHFFAGEVSYLVCDMEEFDFKNAFALKGSTTALIQKTAVLKHMDPSVLDGKKVFELIANNDEDACLAFDEMCTYLAKEIYNLQCIFDPEKILIGGGISRQPILLTRISEKIDQLYKKIPVAIPHPCLDVCRFYNESNLIGALYHYKKLEDHI